MNHTHDDRIAQRTPHQCAAYGCPLMGTMSSSTTGGSDWWCHIHFGKDAVRLQALTVEMNRREWLARAITDMRAAYGTDRWAGVYTQVKHELAMQQRNDLQMKQQWSGDKWEDRPETVWRWILRLERELEAMCKGEFTKPAKQVALISKELPDAGPQRVRLPVPEHV